MVWAISVVLLIAAGGPLVAWLATRGVARRPPGPLTQKFRGTDVWLHERYGVGWLECTQIRTAVGEGKRVSNPALEDAAHGLAARMMDRSGRTNRVLLLAGPVMSLAGIGELVAGISGLGGPVRNAALFVVEGPILIACGVVLAVYTPRAVRRRAKSALDLNRPRSAAEEPAAGAVDLQ